MNTRVGQSEDAEALNQLRVDLELHNNLAAELLQLSRSESECLERSDTQGVTRIGRNRKQILPQLIDSLERLRFHRMRLQAGSSRDSKQAAMLEQLMRQTQDSVMRVLLADRSNERRWLQFRTREAMSSKLQVESKPSDMSQNHYVTNLYRRASRT